MSFLKRLAAVFGIADETERKPSRQDDDRTLLVEQTAEAALKAAREADERRDRLNVIRAERRYLEGRWREER